MDAINMAVLAELKEYAQLYFSAIMEMHTVEGKCNLKPGKYSAKELVDNRSAVALPRRDGWVNVVACSVPRSLQRHIYELVSSLRGNKLHNIPVWLFHSFYRSSPFVLGVIHSVLLSLD